MLSFIRLMIWGLLWIPAWMATTVLRRIKKQPRLDNCFTWALRKWETEDGYLVIRWCRSSYFHWIRWPHFMWLSAENHTQLKHFVPRREDDSTATKLLPDMWFEGRVQTGDDEDVHEN